MSVRRRIIRFLLAMRVVGTMRCAGVGYGMEVVRIGSRWCGRNDRRAVGNFIPSSSSSRDDAMSSCHHVWHDVIMSSCHHVIIMTSSCRSARCVGSMSAGALKKRVLATTEPYLRKRVA